MLMPLSRADMRCKLSNFSLTESSESDGKNFLGPDPDDESDFLLVECSNGVTLS